MWALPVWHRLLAKSENLRRANVLIVVAAHGRRVAECPSAGLVSKPVIRRAASIGYGAKLRRHCGIAWHVNSCGSGVTVVNIDNGFGAGYAASQINALAKK